MKKEANVKKKKLKIVKKLDIEQSIHFSIKNSLQESSNKVNRRRK